MTLLGPEGIHSIQPMLPVQLEVRQIYVQAPIAKQLGLVDGQVVQALGLKNVAVFDELPTVVGGALAFASVGQADASELGASVLQALGFAPVPVADTPGLVVARTLAMLVNEAADAVQQGVCTTEGANAAMKLGVNYPAGPFDWLVRMGDGTTESHQRAQAALHHLWSFTQEFWVETPYEQQARESGIGADLKAIAGAWTEQVDDSLVQATLRRPEAGGHVPTGKQGVHSEHLSYLLAEMQSLARAHPLGQW